MPRFWNGSLAVPRPGFPPVDRLYSTDIIIPEDYEPPFDLDYSRASLTEIADHFKTDKGSIKHQYTPIYQGYLEHLRGAPIRLLEIGVACGCSLKMWARYFSDARIVGADLHAECARLCRTYPNIEIRIADARKDDLGSDYNVIVDDGSHVSADIVDTLKRQWSALMPGGLYFIEDLKCTHNAEYAKNFRPLQPAERFSRALLMTQLDQMMRSMDDGLSDLEAIHMHPGMIALQKAA